MEVSLVSGRSHFDRGALGAQFTPVPLRAIQTLSLGAIVTDKHFLVQRFQENLSRCRRVAKLAFFSTAAWDRDRDGVSASRLGTPSFAKRPRCCWLGEITVSNMSGRFILLPPLFLHRLITWRS
jgi:hypothetical protein